MAAKQDRELLKKVYPSKKWAEKVDKMTPSQISSHLSALKNQQKI